MLFRSAVTGGNTKVLEARGNPIDGAIAPDGTFYRVTEGQAPVVNTRPLRVLPTVHPSFVLRARRWTKAFRADLGRAVRWFTHGVLDWRDPAMTFTPTPQALERFLLANRRLVFDVETAWIDEITGNRRGPTEALLRCIGIGTPYETVCVPFLSIDGQRRYYTPKDELAIVQTLRQWLQASGYEKWGNNCG